MKLQDHLDRLKINPHAWARRNRVSYFAVYRHLKGKRIAYDAAKRISEATNGAVTIPEIME